MRRPTKIPGKVIDIINKHMNVNSQLAENLIDDDALKEIWIALHKELTEQHLEEFIDFLFKYEGGLKFMKDYHVYENRRNTDGGSKHLKDIKKIKRQAANLLDTLNNSSIATTGIIGTVGASYWSSTQCDRDTYTFPELIQETQKRTINTEKLISTLSRVKENCDILIKEKFPTMNAYVRSNTKEGYLIYQMTKLFIFWLGKPKPDYTAAFLGSISGTISGNVSDTALTKDNICERESYYTAVRDYKTMIR